MADRIVYAVFAKRRDVWDAWVRRQSAATTHNNYWASGNGWAACRVSSRAQLKGNGFHEVILLPGYEKITDHLTLISWLPQYMGDENVSASRYPA